MTDVSQLMPFLVLVVIIGGASAAFRLGKRIKRKWARIPVRVVTSITAVIGVLSFLSLSLIETICVKHAPAIESPDGRYIVVIEYFGGGALSDDSAQVSIRTSWNPFAKMVYQGLGSWDLKKRKLLDPEVGWLDSTHLLIGHQDARTGTWGGGGPPFCQSRLGDVEIICRLQ